jgi:hypothetical protein
VPQASQSPLNNVFTYYRILVKQQIVERRDSWEQPALQCNILLAYERILDTMIRLNSKTLRLTLSGQCSAHVAS